MGSKRPAMRPLDFATTTDSSRVLMYLERSDAFEPGVLRAIASNRGLHDEVLVAVLVKVLLEDIRVELSQAPKEPHETIREAIQQAMGGRPLVPLAEPEADDDGWEIVYER